MPVPAFRSILRVLTLLPAVVSLVPLAPAAQPRVERTILPEAAPSAFAVGFSNGVNFCYDPIRGGLSYAWTGDFVDLAPVRPGKGKMIRPVGLRGPIVYREAGLMPLRRGDPSRAANVEFSGYRLGDETIEFGYTVEGVWGRERIPPRPDGHGLQRSFELKLPPGEKLWFVRDGQPPVALVAGADGVFTRNIDFPATVP
jgi:hypothetical protein